MGRPSKLTEAQWETVKQRRLAGETFDSLAREFGLSKAAIIKKLGARIVTVKTVADQIVTARVGLGKLPLVDQVTTLNLADELMATSLHAAGTAKYGMATAHRLAGIANGIVSKIDDANPAASMDDLKMVAALTEVSNKAASTGLNLLASNKDRVNRVADAAEVIENEPTNIASIPVLEAAKAYQDFISG